MLLQASVLFVLHCGGIFYLVGPPHLCVLPTVAGHLGHFQFGVVTN